MILSMTGFGMAVADSENFKITVEMKSLNSKFFELGLKVPRAYMKYENSIRNVITKELERGKITVLIDVETLNPAVKTLNINFRTLEAYILELKNIQHKHNLQPLSLEALLVLPDVIAEEAAPQENEEEWSLLNQTIFSACKALTKSRAEEGLSLEKDFILRLEAIENALAEIEVLAPLRLEMIRNKIQQQIIDLKHKVEIDPNRFEQELIFYIERLDINEEFVRLRQHLSFFREVMSQNGSNGKQLNFIAQEMGREINTIGSKANDATIQRWVVKMKDELEKIKELSLTIV
jgi:uncharacterized protein (TIGR00255 family)